MRVKTTQLIEINASSKLTALFYASFTLNVVYTQRTGHHICI